MQALRLIDELERLVVGSTGGWLGSRFVNETEFLQKIQQLRSAISNAEALQAADKLEQLVTQSKFRWMGKNAVNETQFFTQVLHLRQALSA